MAPTLFSILYARFLRKISKYFYEIFIIVSNIFFLARHVRKILATDQVISVKTPGSAASEKFRTLKPFSFSSHERINLFLSVDLNGELWSRPDERGSIQIPEISNRRLARYIRLQRRNDESRSSLSLSPSTFSFYLVFYFSVFGCRDSGRYSWAAEAAEKSKRECVRRAKSTGAKWRRIHKVRQEGNVSISGCAAFQIYADATRFYVVYSLPPRFDPSPSRHLRGPLSLSRRSLTFIKRPRPVRIAADADEFKQP